MLGTALQVKIVKWLKSQGFEVDELHQEGFMFYDRDYSPESNEYRVVISFPFPDRVVLVTSYATDELAEQIPTLYKEIVERQILVPNAKWIKRGNQLFVTSNFLVSGEDKYDHLALIDCIRAMRKLMSNLYYDLRRALDPQPTITPPQINRVQSPPAN